jgi:hypothetical protein
LTPSPQNQSPTPSTKRERLRALEHELEAMRRLKQTYGYEDSLLEFTRTGWTEVEGIPFVDNWHIACICEHLEAIANQEILRLLGRDLLIWWHRSEPFLAGKFLHIVQC